MLFLHAASPCLLVHGLVHDEAAVDVEHALAHVHVLLQQHLQLIGRLQQEHVRRVSDEDLREREGGGREGGSEEKSVKSRRR